MYQPSSTPARYIRTLLLVFVSLSLLTATGCKNKRPGNTSMTGRFVKVEPKNLPAQIFATGAVTPMVGAEVKVGPRVSGRLKHLRVKVGDHVKKGEVLAQLEDRDLKANVLKAEANLAQAKAEARYAQVNYRRQKKLFSDGYVSPDSVDLALKAKKASEASVRGAQAALDYSKVQLSYATVTSPIEGTIGSVSTQEGETVAASLSAPTFVTIIDLSRLEVDAYVDEVDIGGVKLGQEATFTVDAFQDKTFHGVIQAIYPQAVIQDNVVNYDVIIRITGPFEGLLRPQMTASVNITLGTLKGVLAIPIKAITHKEGKAIVKVKSGEGIVARPVTLGRESGSFVQVTSGLALGDRVLVPASNGNGVTS